MSLLRLDTAGPVLEKSGVITFTACCLVRLFRVLKTLWTFFRSPSSFWLIPNLMSCQTVSNCFLVNLFLASSLSRLATALSILTTCGVVTSPAVDRIVRLMLSETDWPPLCFSTSSLAAVCSKTPLTALKELEKDRPALVTPCIACVAPFSAAAIADSFDACASSACNNLLCAATNASIASEYCETSALILYTSSAM